MNNFKKKISLFVSILFITTVCPISNFTSNQSISGNKVYAAELPIHNPSLSVSKTTDTLLIGGTDTLTVSLVTPGNADNSHISNAVKWTSSNTDVATVNNGVIRAVSAGTTTVTATLGNKAASCTVTVNPAAVNVTGVTLDQSSKTLNIGDKLQLTATIAPSNATNQEVAWSSSNTEVATIDQTGNITAVAAGTATITSTTADGDYKATCDITVVKPVTGVTLDQSSKTLNIGDTLQLMAAVAPSDATNQAVSWSSSNTEVATIDQTGNITAVAAGTATITSTTADGDYKATCNITVVKPVTGVTLDQSSKTLNIGDTLQLIAAVAPSDATNQAVSWSSSNTEVATVDNTGKVTAVAVGTATITVTTIDGNKTASCTTTVVNDPVVTFKNANLEQAVRNAINKPTGDIYKSDVENITTLIAYFQNIQDISGIENLTNLQKLDLSGNPISDLSPLKELTNLQNLYLAWVPIPNWDDFTSLRSALPNCIIYR